MVLSNVFEVLNFFKVAELQLHGDYILLLLIMQSSEVALHWDFPSHHVKYMCGPEQYKCFIPAASIESSLQQSSSAIKQSVGQTLLSFCHSTKYAPTQDANQRCCSSLLPLCSALSQSLYSDFPSPLKIRVKRGISSLFYLW
jgi:hypothetical protein